MMKIYTYSLLFSCLTTVALAQKGPVAPSATGNAEGLIRETVDAGQEFYPRVSPDGKSLLYNSLEKTTYFTVSETGSLTTKTDKKFRIIKKEIGSPVTNPLVVDAAYPTWLPDGSGIIFSYIKPMRPVIARSNGAGVGLNYISQGEMGEDDAEPVINRDMSQIYFTTFMGKSRMICSMDAKGGNFTVLTEGGHLALNPNDNTKIIYNGRVGKVVQVFTLDLKTGQKAQLTQGDYNNKDGAFSRDGKYIAFVSNRENPKKKNHHLYMMKADGTELIQLTQGDTDEGDPTFGPDGTIYFYSNADRNYNIWKVKPRPTR
ncbi:TolB family protein [Fibrella sp. WM1]|uniref:TolB family protein n=1 Tax=Fibrella musci TaxID=3242485 RepID=UPI00351F850F